MGRKRRLPRPSLPRRSKLFVRGAESSIKSLLPGKGRQPAKRAGESSPFDSDRLTERVPLWKGTLVWTQIGTDRFKREWKSTIVGSTPSSAPAGSGPCIWL